MGSSSTYDDITRRSPTGVLLLVLVTLITATVLAGSALVLEGNQGTATAPDAKFTTTFDDDAGRLAIVHSGGEAIPATELRLAVTDPDGSIQETTSWPEVVDEGSSITLSGISGDESVRIVWTGGDVEEVLLNWRPGDG